MLGEVPLKRTLKQTLQSLENVRTHVPGAAAFSVLLPAAVTWVHTQTEPVAMQALPREKCVPR